jgi:hypothetical protein
VRRLLAILPALTLAACAGSHQTVAPAPKTRLTVRVYRSQASAHYTLTCRPAGGSAPAPDEACRALERFLPLREASDAGCFCALDVNRITVGGILDGRRLPRAVEVSGCSACGLGAGARSDVEHAFAAFHLTAG